MHIHELYEKTNDGIEVELCGWARNIRISKLFGFIELNDGTSFKNVQIVFEQDILANFDDIAHLNVGTAVRIKGNVVLTPQAKQPFEVKASEIFIEGESTPEYPLQKKRHSFEYLRTIAHLRPRTNTFSAVFRVRSVAAQAIHRFFHSNNFIYVHTPIITASDAEGAGAMFKVTTLDMQNVPQTENGKIDYKQDFFGKSTNLTVSGQLEGEAYALAFKKIYTFGPTFRAENSNTARHAAEFWMIEPEITFADLGDDMVLAEQMLKYVIKAVMEECPAEMEFFNAHIDNTLIERLKSVITSDFGHITYTDAITELIKNNDNFEYPVKWGVDLQTEHERFITEQIFKKPVFVTDYPRDIKAFYMRQNDDGKTVAAMDLLVPAVGEIIGGSQREERFELLQKRMLEMDISAEEYEWYLDLRRYGGAKHAGFGMGFERAIMYLTGMQNIRDVIPFPRTVGNAEF